MRGGDDFHEERTIKQVRAAPPRRASTTAPAEFPRGTRHADSIASRSTTRPLARRDEEILCPLALIQARASFPARAHASRRSAESAAAVEVVGLSKSFFGLRAGPGRGRDRLRRERPRSETPPRCGRRGRAVSSASAPPVQPEPTVAAECCPWGRCPPGRRRGASLSVLLRCESIASLVRASAGLPARRRSQRRPSRR